MLDHGAPENAVSDPIEYLRHRMRHSAAHVMADAVLQLFPEAKVAIGPPTADGFITISRWSVLLLRKTWNKSKR